jgi:hypothetical protein
MPFLLLGVLAGVPGVYEPGELRRGLDLIDSGVTCVEPFTDPVCGTRRLLSGVGRLGEDSFDEFISFWSIKLFISDKAGAMVPGSAAENAFTAGYTFIPILRARDCWYGQL